MVYRTAKITPQVVIRVEVGVNDYSLRKLFLVVNDWVLMSELKHYGNFTLQLTTFHISKYTNPQV